MPRLQPGDLLGHADWTYTCPFCGAAYQGWHRCGYVPPPPWFARLEDAIGALIGEIGDESGPGGSWYVSPDAQAAIAEVRAALEAIRPDPAEEA